MNVNGPGRKARGFKQGLCRQCETGIAIGTPKTFDPTCSGWQDKKSRGLRTGSEPNPKEFSIGNWRWRRMPKAQQDAVRARQTLNTKARMQAK